MAVIILIVIGIICFAIGADKKNGGGKNDSSASSSVRHCPNCGAPLKPGARECGWCGDCW